MFYMSSLLSSDLMVQKRPAIRQERSFDGIFGWRKVSLVCRNRFPSLFSPLIELPHISPARFPICALLFRCADSVNIEVLNDFSLAAGVPFALSCCLSPLRVDIVDPILAACRLPNYREPLAGIFLVLSNTWNGAGSSSTALQPTRCDDSIFNAEIVPTSCSYSSMLHVRYVAFL